MRKIGNIVGGIGTSGTGNVGDILRKVGEAADAYEWVALTEVVGGLVNGTSGITIPNANEDILYDVTSGFLHRFKVNGVDAFTVSDSVAALTTLLSVVNGDQTAEISTIRATHASFTGTVQELSVNRAEDSGFDFLTCVTDVGGTPNIRLSISGTGQISSDQPSIINGADYAETFEWEDGNPIMEDRTGMTVCLSTTSPGKIRVATAFDPGHKVIGAISGKPTSIGNAEPMHWRGKYPRDLFGRQAGQEAVPEFNHELSYLPRHLRKEWGVVGLLGQIPIWKGQPVHPNWVFIKDLSKDVALYLVK